MGNKTALSNMLRRRQSGKLSKHGGDFRQCSTGETLKPFDEIADYLRDKVGFDDIANCPTFNY